jgi:RHS repeat-associated protein
MIPVEGIEAVVNVTSCGEPHRGFLVEHETRTGGKRRRRAAFHRGFHLATFRRASRSTNLLVDAMGTSGLSQAVAETDGNGNLTALYVRNRDQLLAVVRPGSTPGTWVTRFIHGDGLGSVRALTDETGATTDSRAYQAFGTKNVEAGSDPLAYGFAGEPFEGTSSLAYHRARWMDARVGRFLGMDPAQPNDGQPISLHRYIYGSDEPTGVVDPTGNDGIDADFSLRSIVNYLTASPNVVTGNVPNAANSYGAALSKALSAAANLSLSTYARASNQLPDDHTALHPEVEGFVFEALTATGNKWGWISATGAADMVPGNVARQMWFIGIPQGAVPWAVFHTHPNSGVGYNGFAPKTGNPAYIVPTPDAFSSYDRDSLWLWGQLSQNPWFTSYVVDTSTHDILRWQYGFSAPDVGSFGGD